MINDLDGGRSPDGAGLSPTVEPVPVSPPDGASIPSAKELKTKLRNVISHATGGGFSDPNASLNEIGVRISQHHNRVWKHAQEDLLAALNDVLDTSGARGAYHSLKYSKAVANAEALIAKARGAA